ncbi:MAG: UDP-3-O-acyl-N-acetylglucosamine deacetylase, partial [Pandoraea sp.]|nr:UDP-3-O-acyl-N-acetylglucosamine deacetylase [Pandoraea sp.]
QAQARTAIKVLKPVLVEQGQARAALLPAESLSYHLKISFPQPAIGDQSLCESLNAMAYSIRDPLSPSDNTRP